MRKRVALALTLSLVLVFTAVPVLAEEAFDYTSGVQKVVLKNGMTVLLKENPAFNIIAVVIMSNVGSVQDPEGLEGLTYLTQRNFLSGTKNRTALELVTELESLGTHLQSVSGLDYCAVLMETLPDTLQESMDIVLDILGNSTFPEAEFERERALSMALVQSLTDDPMNALFMAYGEVFYGDHPYRYTTYGTWEGLAAVQREQVSAWQQYMYRPENLTVAVVGNFELTELLPYIEESLGGWETDASLSLTPRQEVPFDYPAEDRQLVINLPTEAAFLMLGYPAPNTYNPDSAAMQVIDTVLGGGLSSRLFVEIRDKQGLAYSAASQYDERLGPSNLLTFVATHPANVDLVREQVLYQMQRFAEEGLTEEEIAAVTTRLRGIYLLNNETNISQAILLATAEMIGLGYGWVDEYMSFFDNVTPEDIKRVASEYFQNYTEVLITP